MARDRRRRPPRSARWPITGAVSAMTSPATAMEIESHVAAENGPSRSAPTESVRYTENTKVTITALKAADPQSHMPHATTRPRGTDRADDGWTGDAADDDGPRPAGIVTPDTLVGRLRHGPTTGGVERVPERAGLFRDLNTENKKGPNVLPVTP